MIAFDDDPKLRWLFCMTHPDDEISICAWIHRLARQGNDVFICWTHSNQVREAEARAVATILGVKHERLIFHDAEDGGVAQQIPTLLTPFKKMIEDISPDRVCCGAFEQGHIDHDATNLIVNHTFSGPVFEIPFYHAYYTRFQRLNRFADPAGEQILDLSLDEQQLKMLVARQFPSQNIWSILTWYERWHKVRRRPMDLVQTERMRLQQPTDYLKPALPRHLAEKVRRTETWRAWELAVKEARRTLELQDGSASAS